MLYRSNVQMYPGKDLGLSFAFIDPGLRLGSDGKKLLWSVLSYQQWVYVGIMKASNAGKCSIKCYPFDAQKLTCITVTFRNLQRGETRHTTGMV